MSIWNLSCFGHGDYGLRPRLSRLADPLQAVAELRAGIVIVDASREPDHIEAAVECVIGNVHTRIFHLHEREGHDPWNVRHPLQMPRHAAIGPDMPRAGDK